MGTSCYSIMGGGPPPAAKPLSAARTMLAQHRRELVRSNTGLEREQRNTVKAIRAAHNRKDVVSTRELASAYVRSKRQQERLSVAISRVEQCQNRVRSVRASGRSQDATLAMAGALRDVNHLLSSDATPEIAAAYRRELARYCVLQDFMNAESTVDDDDDASLNSAADAALIEATAPSQAASTQPDSAPPALITDDDDSEIDKLLATILPAPRQGEPIPLSTLSTDKVYRVAKNTPTDQMWT